MIRWRPCPGRPSTNQRERERHPETLCTAPGLHVQSWLPPSAAKHQPDTAVTTQGRGGAAVDGRTRRGGASEQARESKRSNEAESPTPLKQQKAAVYVAFTDFTHEEVMAKKTVFAQCVSSGFN